MQVDWITVTAQIINFLVLVWLLQHFLYQPVIRAMDRREQRIAERLNEAGQRETEAREQIDEYRQKQARLEEQRQSLLEDYRREAREEKQRLLEEARGEVEETRRHWQRQAGQEKREFLENLSRQTGRTVAEIAGKALADLADIELEERVVDLFIERLKDLDEETLRDMPASGEKLRVSTAHDLDQHRRGRITRALHEQLGKELEIEYEKAPDLICGIRLADDGHAVDWNLADYLAQLTERMESAIDDAVRQA
ncbi:MAG TPA: F0F1 ATP synthase subunit delta [Arenicellales bacterium]|nr:F0F1 ATP synthase subunit delta [Arenicellales bacterium]